MARIERLPIERKTKIVAGAFFSFALIFMLVLVGYNFFSFHNTSVTQDAITSANIMNGSQVYRSSDGTVIFSKSDGVYFYNSGDTSVKKIFDQPATNIGSIKSTTYFESNGSLYSCIFDGSHVQKLLSGGSDYQVEGSYIYYLNPNGTIEKTRLDKRYSFVVKTAEPIVTNNISSGFIVNSGQILYKALDGIHIASTDGSADRLIYTGDIKSFFIEQSAIFVQNANGDTYICDASGARPELIVNADCVTVFGDNFVYTSGGKIYLINISKVGTTDSGSEKQPIMLLAKSTHSLYNFNKNIYYFDENGQLNMMTTKGEVSKIA